MELLKIKKKKIKRSVSLTYISFIHFSLQPTEYWKDKQKYTNTQANEIFFILINSNFNR